MADPRSRPQLSLGAPPSPIAGDPQLPQLSSSYWDRVRQQAAIQRASRPDTAAADARARDQNQLIAPPGPQPDAAAGAAYRKGGKIKAFGFAKGGSSKSGKDWSKGGW